MVQHGLSDATSTFGTAQGAPGPHRRRNGTPHFTITPQGQRCDFLVLQEQDRTEHIPTKKELADAEKNSWVRIPRYGTSPAERLSICVSGGLPHRAGEWADTTSRPLEDQLAEIVQEVGLRGEAAEGKSLADIGDSTGEAAAVGSCDTTGKNRVRRGGPSPAPRSTGTSMAPCSGPGRVRRRPPPPRTDLGDRTGEGRSRGMDRWGGGELVGGHRPNNDPPCARRA